MVQITPVSQPVSNPYFHTSIQTFSQSLESWKQKNPSATTSSAGHPLVSRPVGLLDFLTEEDIERYRSMARAAVALMEL